MIPTFQRRHWDHNSNVKVNRPREGASRLAQQNLPAKSTDNCPSLDAFHDTKNPTKETNVWPTAYEL